VHDGLDDGLNEAENNMDEPEDKLSQNITYEQPPININGARIILGVTNTMVQIRTPVGARLLREPISQGRDQEAYNSPQFLALCQNISGPGDGIAAQFRPVNIFECCQSIKSKRSNITPPFGPAKFEPAQYRPELYRRHGYTYRLTPRLY